MEENKSVISGEFDRTGRYDAGLKSLAGSLRAAFMLLLIGIIATLVYFFSGAGYFSVEPQQAVIVVRFGKIIKTFTTGGHWYLPYPVNQFVRVQTSQQLLNVDFIPADIPGRQPDASLEPGVDNYLMTGDANIVHTSWTVTYRITDPQLYYSNLLTPPNPVENGKVVPDEVFTNAAGMKSSRGPQTLLRNLFTRAAISVTASSQVQDILYAGQSTYSNAVQSEFIRLVAAAQCGVEIDNVSLNRIFPPVKTKAAFDEVTAASNISGKLKSEAEAFRTEMNNNTEAAIKEITSNAAIYRDRLTNKFDAEREYFEKICEAYLRNGKTVPMALYTEMLNEIAKNIQGDRFILGTSGKNKQLWLKLNPEPKKEPGQQPAEGR